MKISVILDTRARKKDGTFPVKIAVAHRGSTAYIPLDVSVRRDQWRGEKVVLHQNAAYMNAYILQRYTEAQNALLAIRTEGEAKAYTSAYQLRDAIVRRLQPEEQKPVTFAEWFARFVEKHENPRTREIYTATWKWIERYDTRADTLLFEDVTKDWLERFFVFMAGRSPAVNARNIHLRNIRAVFNDAIDNDITTAYPFRRLHIRPEPTAKRNLTPDVLRALFATELPAWKKKYLDVFRLSFYLIGMNMADLLTLTPDNARDGRIVYTRRKTHRQYSVKIEPEAAAIIERYRGSRLLLSWAERCADYRTFAAKTNKALGEIHTGLTTYWARHSWATIAASLDIPEDTIALALGHASAHATTSIYIERSLQKVDEANRRVLDMVK